MPRRSRTASLLGVVLYLSHLLLASQAYPRHHARAASAHEHVHAGAQRLLDLIDEANARPFIYVYDLPRIINEDLFHWSIFWHGEAYEADIKIYHYLMSHPSRTLDPCQADVFFMPIFVHKMVEDEYMRGDLDCHFGGRAECDMGLCSFMDHAIRSAINLVKHYFPFWNATMGANHVIVLASDHGICDSMPLLVLNRTAERMVALEPNRHWLEQRWLAASELPMVPPETFVTCFRAGYDFVIPPFVGNGTVLQPVSPFATRRPAFLTARFGDNGDEFRVRGPWLEFLEAKVPDLAEAGSPLRIVAGKETFNQTFVDFRQSLFCLAPQGMATFTGRLTAIIMAGCIPVTFFRALSAPMRARAWTGRAFLSTSTWKKPRCARPRSLTSWWLSPMTLPACIACRMAWPPCSVSSTGIARPEMARKPRSWASCGPSRTARPPSFASSAAAM